MEYQKTVSEGTLSVMENNATFKSSIKYISNGFKELVLLSYKKMEESLKKSWLKDITNNYFCSNMNYINDFLLYTKKYVYSISFNDFMQCNFKNMKRYKK